MEKMPAGFYEIQQMVFIERLQLFYIDPQGFFLWFSVSSLASFSV